MPTAVQVLTALGADSDYDRVARIPGIHPGQAYLVATGLPADGGDAFIPGRSSASAVAFEDRVFPALSGAISGDESAKLGRKIYSTEQRGPTRPHSQAPKKPAPVAEAAAAGGAVLDRLAGRQGQAEQEPGQEVGQEQERS